MRESTANWPWQVAFRTQEDQMPGHRMAAETIFFPRTGYGGLTLTSLEVIWEMSVDKAPGNYAGSSPRL
jgi:hypothetical protein